MAATSADVPGKFDVVVDGVGYVFARTLGDNSGSLALRSQRGDLGYTPTFLPRTNTSGNYGDDNQAFWLTASQNNWVQGEQQRFFRAADTDSVESFWRGDDVDISIPGQVSMRPTRGSFSNANPIVTASADIPSLSTPSVAYATSTNLLSQAAGGGTTDHGTHGLGGTPAKTGMVGGKSIYLTSEGGAKIRKWDGAAFSTFCATGYSSLDILNNTLFGVQYGFSGAGTALVLHSISTAGVTTTVYTWLDPDGTGVGNAPVSTAVVKAFGPQLMILVGWSNRASELYQYNGTTTSLVARFPKGVVCGSMEELDGVLYIGGAGTRNNGGTLQTQGYVFSYSNNTFGLIWKSTDYYTATSPFGPLASYPFVCSYQGLLLWNDDTTGRVMAYTPSNGSVAGLFDFTVTGDSPVIASSPVHLLMTRNQTTAYNFPQSITAVTSATLYTSIFDFDTALTKQFRGVKVDWQAATDGDGGSVDLYYQVDSLDGAYTLLQTGAVSGTEYPLSVSGHGVSIKIVLNKGTSTKGPILKRTYVRASPLLQQFRRGTYTIDCTGKKGANNNTLNNGQPYASDGQALLTSFLASAKKTSLITITDNISTYTGIVELDSISVIPTRPSEYLVRFSAREV